ncbi:MAG: YitT family protein [Pseudomonadota bacterium]
MLNIIHHRHFIRNSIGIIIGSIIYGMGYAWFLIPYKIAPGGVGGLSQIFYHFFGIPAGVCMLAMNIPLFVLGVWLVGKQFGMGTFTGFLLGSVFTDLLAVKNIYKLSFMQKILEQYNQGKPIHEWAMTDNILLAALAGSILLGAGIGIIFRAKGSTGGTDIPVAILKKYYNMSITTGYLVIETGIIFLIGIVFKNPNIIIWGLFNLFLASKVCDLTAEGLPYTKGVFVITDKSEEIAESLMDKLGRGVTYFYGEGAYSHKKKKIVMCVINRRQTNILRDWVRKIDPDAFIILTEVSDVMGYGFKSRHLDMSDNPH